MPYDSQTIAVTTTGDTTAGGMTIDVEVVWRVGGGSGPRGKLVVQIKLQLCCGYWNRPVAARAAAWPTLIEMAKRRGQVRISIGIV